MEEKSSFKNFLTSQAGKTILIVLMYIIIWGLMLLITKIFSSGTGQSIAAVVFIVVFSFFGWKSLNKITPDIFLVMPVGGWIAYFVIKLVLSIIVGVFVAPYVIAKNIYEIIEIGVKEQ